MKKQMSELQCWGWSRAVILAGLMSLIAGQAGMPGATNQPADRVKVVLDTSRLVEVSAWGAKAVDLVKLWHPRIHALLGKALPAEPAAVKLIFEEGDGVADTSGNTIKVYAPWVRAHPEDLGLVVHELVHVVQAYPSPEPGWVTEGLADCIRFWHFESKPQTRIDKAKASYRDGYRTAGAFFAWADKRHPGLLKRLNSAMETGTYNDQIFFEISGRTLPELWDQFLAQWRD